MKPGVAPAFTPAASATTTQFILQEVLGCGHTVGELDAIASVGTLTCTMQGIPVTGRVPTGHVRNRVSSHIFKATPVPGREVTSKANYPAEDFRMTEFI